MVLEKKNTNRHPVAVSNIGMTISMDGSEALLYFDSSDGAAKNALYVIGRKYAALSSELIRKIMKAHCWLESRVPLSKYHLLMNPPVGGNPITQSEPRKNAVIVSGIFRPIPFIWLMYLAPQASYIAPAQRNSVILPMACMGICSAAPAMPLSDANPTPSII